MLLIFGSLKTFSQAGAAIKFDGASDFVDLGSAITTSLNGGNSITIEAWVNTATNSGGHGPIVGNYNTNNAGALSFLLRRENGHHVFWVGNGTIYPTVSLNTSTLNVWTHLACVWNGTTATVYVNGVPTASSAPTLTAMQNYSNTSVYIGSAPLIGEHFNGMIDEVRIWNVARTQCQINTYKNCEIPANAPGLLVNYHFNQGIANGNNTAVTTLTDATSSTITGTLAGITLTGTTSNWVAPGGVVSGFTTALVGPSYSATSLSACSGKTISLTSTGATSFTWSPGVTNAVAFTPTASAGYTITNINNVTSCSNTAVANVTVNALPVINATTTNTLICVGQSANLTASGASTYTWNPGAIVSNTISVTPAITTSYTVSGTGVNGCNNASVITLNVSACTSLNQTTNSGNEITFYPNPTSSYLTIKTNETIESVTVFNLIGEAIQHESKNTFSVELLPVGIYIIQIKTANGIGTARFIKE